MLSCGSLPRCMCLRFVLFVYFYSCSDFRCVIVGDKPSQNHYHNAIPKILDGKIKRLVKPVHKSFYEVSSKVSQT